ncbi:MAG: aspartate 1-decarboxylase [Omnitrophica bacterium RIFCSPHIGHO2_02_FULL_46_11]|nr:MAG: aspartate 1-decarboxylase [Omnitrophica bacterium RIFCSPHIGHO2_02_FULL_46_11]OGW87692.1 MAG: aspartate 1-decarboxylase [Omnitrophica bacterium RIFCSPLOWO2_01_FULL_45_10b]
MIRQMLKSKIHRATVTDAHVDYEGSITIDEQLMVEANILEHEKVLVANLSNGSRVETYVIVGKWGSGLICANGGAALHNKVGDKVLIMSFCALDDREAKKHRPQIVKVDEKNRPIRKG